MNIAVEIFKVLAAMSDHWPRKRGHRFGRHLDWARNEKLIVWKHAQTLVARRRFSNETDVAAALDPALLYFGDIVVMQTQAHVLFDIVR